MGGRRLRGLSGVTEGLRRGYGGVTAGLRGAFFGFAGVLSNIAAGRFFGPFRESVQNFGGGVFGRFVEMCSKSRDCTFLTF